MPRTANRKPQQNKNLKENVSYEDVIIAQYLDELRKSPSNKVAVQHSNGHLQSDSPYLQRLAHAHILPSPGVPQRPQSAATGSSCVVGVSDHAHSVGSTHCKPSIDAKFIDNHDLWDPATPRQQKSSRRRRPISAPVRPRSRAMNSQRSLRPQTTRSLYRYQPLTIVVLAFRNGTRDVFARITAPNMKILLELCTEKLGLLSAARRVFLRDGTDVHTPEQIPRRGEIYASTGEPFKDPYCGAKNNSKINNKSMWTVNGLIFSQEKKNNNNKSLLSKRFRLGISDQSKRRVLVYKNGCGNKGFEIVASIDKFEDFLVSCTLKLDLGTYARILYDWNGVEVQRLHSAPVMDMCLQRSSTAILGPLWVSKGEGFSPKGVQSFLSGLIDYTQLKLTEAENYQQQLRDVQDPETREKVEIVVILSMSQVEIEHTLDIVAKDIEDFSNALNRLRLQMDKLEDQVKTEEREGMSFKLKHIEKFQSDHKLIGVKGLRLMVFTNGCHDDETAIFFNLQQANRGLMDRPTDVLNRLLDQCGATISNKGASGGAAVPSRLFDCDGREITDVNKLEYDQEIWLSYGEQWTDPYTYTMSCTFDRVRVYEIDEEIMHVCREQMMSMENIRSEKWNQWEVAEGVAQICASDSFDPSRVSSKKLDPADWESMRSTIADNALDTEGHYLRDKMDCKCLIYMEPCIIKKGIKDIWPGNSDCWLFSKTGHIYSKAMPQMALTVVFPTSLSFQLSSSRQTYLDKSYLVTLKHKTRHLDAEQKWTYTPEACIVLQSQPEFHLTFVGQSDPRSLEQKPYKGENFSLAASVKITGKDSRLQRWCIKQEKLNNIGQWKCCKLGDANWNKKALSWPVDFRGLINEDYVWPMEGFLMPYAPVVKRTLNENDSYRPIRLQVLHNGDNSSNAKPIVVVGPDLANMKKDQSKLIAKSKSLLNAKGNQQNNDQDLSVSQLEFILFMDHCTSLLSLPFAARRLFDHKGQEFTDLSLLDRDQKVFISCGDAWIDPSISKSEHQRRYLVSNMTSDVRAIDQFLSLRNPKDLILSVYGPLEVGSRLFVKCNATKTETEESEVKSSPQKTDLATENDDKIIAEIITESAHEISHARSEERMNNRRWPWERIINDDLAASEEEEVVHANEAKVRNNKTPKNRSLKNNSSIACKFTFENNFIISSDPSLVLGISKSDKDSSFTKVILVKRKNENPSQMWIADDTGLILNKADVNLALTVHMTFDPRGHAAVVLAPRVLDQFGRANQKWAYEHQKSLLHCFQTNTMDKEVTAADVAGVCSYSVFGDLEIDQQAFSIESQPSSAHSQDHPDGHLVCAACARVLRSRTRVRRLAACDARNRDFACAMGRAKTLGIRHTGSFKCLNGKIDLSTHEAEHSFAAVSAHLEQLRRTTSARQVAKSIAATSAPYTVKIRARANGVAAADNGNHGNQDQEAANGKLVVGSSIAGLLDQISYLFGVTARRLYSGVGEPLLTVDDILSSAQRQFLQRAKSAADKLAASSSSSDKDKLIGGVDLDSSDSDHAEDKDSAPQTRLGFDSSGDRQRVDRWQGYVVVPSPGDKVTSETAVVKAWNVYTSAAGEINFMMLSPDVRDASRFTVVTCERFEAPSSGLYRVEARAHHVCHRGDVIAFHCRHAGIVIFDVSPEGHGQKLANCASASSRPEVGQQLELGQVDPAAGARRYSINVELEPVQGQDKKTKKKKKRAGTGGSSLKTRSATTNSTSPDPPLPSVEQLLRCEIDVWFSAGEAFKVPEEVTREREEEEQRYRQVTAPLARELDLERHVFRHAAARGASDIEDRADNLQRLQNLVAQSKVTSTDTNAANTANNNNNNGRSKVQEHQNRRLYTQPTIKRFLVFNNGESVDRAVYVWADSLQELMINAGAKLCKQHKVKVLYDQDGNTLTSFDELRRDHVICVSAGAAFHGLNQQRRNVHVKANWSRARRTYGNEATDIVVNAAKNTNIEVDPFGHATLNNDSTTTTTMTPKRRGPPS